MQRVVGLRCAVRTRLNRALAESTIYKDRSIVLYERRASGFRGEGRGEREIYTYSAGGRRTGITHRTSIVRASKDARRDRSFSTAGGSSGIAALPLSADVVVL